ncbi:MAG: universal stress protein [Bacteroidetes bacterium]|nr:universal stress protein [Bacteroidota bacterium]
MKKILVAIDFSEHTIISCKYAIEIAKINKAEICLFHTCFDNILITNSSIPDAYTVNSFVDPELNSEIKQSANKQMLDLRNDMILKLQNENITRITINTIITNNDFESDLIDFCDDFHPSIVIIGTKGKGESLKVFGTIASKIIDNLRFPVLAVPEIDAFLGVKNVMYTTDLHTSDDVLIRKTFNLLENFDVKMFCVHIVEKNDYLQAYSKMDDLKLIYSKEVDDKKFYCDVLESNNIHDEIDKLIKSNKIDLIIFLPHKTNLFQRLFGQHFSKKYLFETNLPLLAIRL